MHISNNRKTNPRAYSSYTSSDKSNVRRHGRHHPKRRGRRYRSRRQYRSPKPPVRERDLSKFGLKVLITGKERYQKAVDHRYYRSIYKSEWHDYDMASDFQKMRKKVAVQMKDQAFNGKDSISVVEVLTEFKRAFEL